MNDCLIIGAGGHAKSLISCMLNQKSNWKIRSIIDLNFIGKKEQIFGIDVIGSDHNFYSFLENLKVKNIFLALGDNSHRKMIFHDLKERGYHFPNFTSSTTIIKNDVTLGEANIFLERTYVGPCTNIGSNNIFNTNSIIEHDCTIGSHTHFAPRTVVSGYSKVGDDCLISTGATIVNKVKIVSNVTLAAGSTIFKSITQPGLYAGSPATFKRDLV